MSIPADERAYQFIRLLFWPIVAFIEWSERVDRNRERAVDYDPPGE